jgi:UDP-2,4-diacetamido-2,4,6-trideoxy-beta-L-altropyranose hydrolase
MKVIFRVDASLQIGSGHVMRCLTLAEVLRENGAKVKFICRKHSGNLIKKIKEKNFQVIELEVSNNTDVKLKHASWLGATQQQDADDCIDILKAEKLDWLIVDHYALDEQWQKRLKPCYEKLMVIDDLADRKHLCDILLDQTYGRNKRDYESLVHKSCKMLLGSQYALLRPEFAKWRPYSLKRRRKPEFKQLLINMGGVDVDNVTGRVLEELKTCNLPRDINITVVMGGSALHLESVRAKVDTLPYKTVVRDDVDNMAEIMANADIAIGAAGATTWERCCLGLPTIQIVIAKNQNIIARSLTEKNAIKLLQDKKELSSMISGAISWMEDVSNVAQQISDGLGSTRVVSAIIVKKI